MLKNRWPGWAMQGGGGFNPNSIANLMAWWKADSGLTIVPATSFHWLDKIGGKDLAQTTGGLVPTTTTVNGKLAPVGDGVDDFVQAAFTLVPPYTLFYIVRQLTASANACQIGGANGGVTSGIFFGTRPNTDVRLFLSGAAEIDALGTDALINTTYIYSGSTSGTAQNLRTSGVNRASGASVASTDAAGIRLFCTGSGTTFANCAIPEVLLYSRVLTDPEKLQVERYAAAGWGAACA